MLFFLASVPPGFPVLLPWCGTFTGCSPSGVSLPQCGLPSRRVRLQPCPQRCLPPRSPNAPLHISPHMSSPCFSCISSPVSKHISSLNSAPNGCRSRLNMFEWRHHVLLWLEFWRTVGWSHLFQSYRRQLWLAQGTSWPPRTEVTPTAPATETLPVLPSTLPFPKPCQFCPIYLLFVSAQQPAHLLQCTAGFCL